MKRATAKSRRRERRGSGGGIPKPHQESSTLALLEGCMRQMDSKFRLGTLRKFCGPVLAWLEKHTEASKGCDEFGLDPALMETLRPFFQFLYYNYFRVEALGVEHVPSRGPAILVANHSGALPYDGTMIHLAIYNSHTAGRGARFLVDDFVFQIPLLGSFIRRTGGVPASHDNAMQLIDRGHLVVVFPEGVRGISKTYDERYQLRRFGRGGFVRLAIRTGVPIIPVAVIGAEEIHPIVWKSRALARPLGLPFIPFTPTFPWLGPLGLVPLPSKWQITFGKPIWFDKYELADAADDELVWNEATRIRNRIQRMLNKALETRMSIWI